MPRSKSLLNRLEHFDIQILKKVKLKWTLHIFMRKKVQIQDIIVLCVWDWMGMERGGEGRDGRTDKKKKDT